MGGTATFIAGGERRGILTQERELELCCRAQSGDEAANTEIVQRFMPQLRRFVGKRFGQRSEHEREDLEAIGVKAVLRALQSYDTERPDADRVRFSRHLNFHLKQRVYPHALHQSQNLRPFAQHKRYSRFIRWQSRTLKADNMSDAEAAEASGLT